MKKYVLTFICTITLGLIGSTTLLAADLTCARDGNNKITTRTECGTQPDEQYITIKRIAFCTQAPTLADTVGAVVNTTGCTDVFVNSTGVEILITPTGSALPSFIDPPAGTYTHAYVELSPNFRVKTIQRFSLADGLLTVKGTEDEPLPADSYNSGTGTICWSLFGTINNARTKTPHMATCGTTEPAAAAVRITTSNFNAIVGNQGAAAPIMRVVVGGSGMALLSSSRALLDVPVKTGDGASAPVGAILAAWKAMPFTTYGAGLTSYTASFPNTRGTNVNFNDNARNITNFGAADIDFILTTSRSGGTN